MFSSKSAFLVAFGRPVQGAHGLARRVGLVEIGVLRNGALRARRGRSTRRYRTMPNGWQEPHEPQPLLDIRPVMGAPPVVAGSNSPTDV